MIADWTPQWVAIACGWGAAGIFIACLILARGPWRQRQFVGYWVVLAIAMPLWVFTHHDPRWNWDLITAEALVADYIVFFAGKAFLLRRTSWIGLAMARQNWALAGYFLATQIWLLWDGGRVEVYLMLAARAVLALTVNDGQAALLEPPPPYQYEMRRSESAAPPLSPAEARHADALAQSQATLERANQGTTAAMAFLGQGWPDWEDVLRPQGG